MGHEPDDDAWAAFGAALEAIADPLIESLDAFHAAGVPEGAQYVVVWVPLGPPEFVKLTYMDKGDVLAGDGPQPVAVNRQLARLVDALPDGAASRSHETVFEWIRRAMARSPSTTRARTSTSRRSSRSRSGRSSTDERRGSRCASAQNPALRQLASRALAGGPPAGTWSPSRRIATRARS